jgi:hypothetical protein
MGLYRAFVQQATSPTVVATNQFPNSSTIFDLTNLTPTPSVPVVARPGNRRGLLFENDGTLPIVFSLGTTVSVSARTGILFATDYYEDLTGWQGPVAVAAVGGNSGALNITEVVYI